MDTESNEIIEIELTTQEAEDFIYLGEFVVEFEDKPLNLGVQGENNEQ